MQQWMEKMWEERMSERESIAVVVNMPVGKDGSRKSSGGNWETRLLCKYCVPSFRYSDLTGFPGVE